LVEIFRGTASKIQNTEASISILQFPDFISIQEQRQSEKNVLKTTEAVAV